ncbi:hypothetical protein EBS57_09895, partial [bacterium]|nr:hypothetical protein [bacterium]
MSEYYFIDGQQLLPTSFAKTDPATGQWIPKRYTGTYGTNGFYLNFSDNSATTATALGKDSSGNNNNFTPNNFSVAAGAGNDSLVDSPTNYGTDTGLGGEVRGNYCTLNALATGSYATLSDGSIIITGSSATNSGSSLGTLGFYSGKFYYEFTVTSTTGAFGGVVTYYSSNTSTLIDENNTYGSTGSNKGIGIRGSGSIYGNTSEKQTISAFTFSTTDVMGVAVDADNGAVYFSKNGVWLNSGLPTSGSSRTGSFHNWTSSTDRICYPAFAAYNGGACLTNFGQRPFAYAAPSGFKSLCTHNLPTPAVVKSNTAFDATLWVGDATASRNITGFNFAPDLVWIKNRTNSYSHYLSDTVRGVNKQIYTDATEAESSLTTVLSAFNSDGFTIGNNVGVNNSGSN